MEEQILKAWKVARPWLLEHLQELLDKGWTRKKLFQAGRLSFPHGPWGPAWSPNWLRPEVEVSIDPDGTIRWTWVESSGKTVSQSAAPKH